MKSLHPATAGTWLLERAGVDDGLAGDLAEQLGSRRSVAWYWYQVLLAIAMLWINTIASHKWLAARAVATGWVLWACLFVAQRLLNTLPGASAWAADTSTVLRYGGWVLIGWLVGLLHRPYQGPMVLAYAVFTLIMSTPVVSRMVVSVLGHPSYTSPSAGMLALAIVSLVVGGLLSAAGVRGSGGTAPRTPSHSIPR